MGREAQVCRGCPPRSDKVGHDASTSSRSRGRPSAISQRIIFKSFSLCNFFVLLTFARSCFGAILPQANFTVQATDYNCSSNLICLGGAHVYNGSATERIQSGRLSLIPENHNDSAGIAYYNVPVKLLDLSTNKSASFSTTFSVDVVEETYVNSTENIIGDGMTFVISADNSTEGGGGGSLGIFNENGTTPLKSIVVEFDTFLNVQLPLDDISANHVSFDFRNVTAAPAANISDLGFEFGAGSTATNTIYAWVDYTAEIQLLEVSVNTYNNKPNTSLLNVTVNLFDVVEEYMWVGFSSGAGSLYSNYYIGDWTFRSSGIPIPPAGGRKKKSGLIVGLSVGIPAAIILVCIGIALIVQRMSGDRGAYRHCRLGWRGFVEMDSMMIQIEGMPERFSYKQLSVATKHFSEEYKLGEGGFGDVYSGVLPSSSIPVAVKRIRGHSTQGEKEFMAEVSIISRLRHRNLIQLLGWCNDASKEKYLLVYELMPNGSLDKALFGPAEQRTACLSWPQRFNIVTGTAAALDYLHQGWTQQVIHRDIKSSNIMLDGEWNAKLGDFGLARLVDHQREAATTMVAGTFGYIAPEVAASGRFTEKTDVFAFGAVVLEVACGRKALAYDVPEDELILVDWVWRCMSAGDLMSTVDKTLDGDYDEYWMEVILIIGLLCSHPDPLARPTMRQVVQVLAGDAPVPTIAMSKPAPSFRSIDFSGPISGSNSRPRFRTIPSSISIDFSSPTAENTPRSRFGSASVGSSYKTDSLRGSVVKASGIFPDANPQLREQIRSPVKFDSPLASPVDEEVKGK